MNQVFQRLLTLRLGVKKFFLLLEEGAVVPMHAEQPVGINPIEFGHLGCDILQEVAVVTYDRARECSPLQ